MTTSVESARPERAFAPPDVPAGPATCAAVSPDDLGVVLLALVLQSRGAQHEAARADAERAHHLLEEARRQIQEAIERAEEAEESAGLWGDISDALGSDLAAIAGAVAAVSLVVATGGAGTAAVIALVAAGLTVGAKAGQELGADPRLTAALSVTGGLLGLFAGNAAGAGNVWSTTAQVANGVQGAATAGGGGARIAEGQYRGEALEARADVRVGEGRQNDAWLRLDLAIREIEDACRDIARGREGASVVERNESEGARAVIARIGGA